MGALSLTASKPQQKRRFSPLVPRPRTSGIPTRIAAAPAARRKRKHSRWGCARYIEDKLFKTVLAPEEVAAIFVEPIQARAATWLRPPS